MDLLQDQCVLSRSEHCFRRKSYRTSQHGAKTSSRHVIGQKYNKTRTLIKTEVNSGAPEG